ncbi:HAD hydrolase-like protein [Labrys neptuniae]
MSASAASVLLDLDGTIIDSQPGIVSSCRAALRALGYEPEPTLDLSRVIGPPIEDVFRYLLEPHGDDRIEAAVAAYRTDYGQQGLFDSLPYAGIDHALAEMRQAGLALYVATSKRRYFAQRILDHLGLAASFDGIYGSEDGAALDHKPELISHVIARHGLVPGRCVMVGDRRYDIVGAQANKIGALGVLWGYGTRDELEAAGADGLVAETADLPAAALKMITTAGV